MVAQGFVRCPKARFRSPNEVTEDYATPNIDGRDQATSGSPFGHLLQKKKYPKPIATANFTGGKKRLEEVSLTVKYL